MTNEESESPLDAAKQKAFETLFGNLPEDFAIRYELLKALHRAFHEGVAAALEPALNEHVKKQSAEGLQAKLQLASWVDTVTRDVGVTTCDPRTKRPVIMTAEHEEPFNKRSRTQFAFLVGEKGGISRAYIAGPGKDLELSLTSAPSNIESLYQGWRYSPTHGQRKR